MRSEYERDETSAATKLTYLLVGGGIGAVLALLFAPKSGHELRGDIADVTRKGIEKGKETATQKEITSWISTTGAAGSAKFAAALIAYPHEVCISIQLTRIFSRGCANA